MERNHIRVPQIILALVLVSFYPACFSPVADLSTTEECLEEGRGYEKLGKYKLALKCYDRAVRLDSHDARGYFFRAVAKSNLHDHKGAISDYTKAIALKPRQAAYFTLRGLSRRKIEDWDGARADFLKAVEIDDKYQLAYWELADIAKKREKYSEASLYYTKAIEAEPDSKSVCGLYTARGVVERARGNCDSSRRDFMKALELNPSSDTAWCNMGNLELELGNSAEAIHAYEKSLKLDPESNITHNNLGMAFLVSGQFDKAIELFTKAVEIKPSYARAVTNRGVTRFASGQLDHALADFEKAFRIDPGSTAARFYSVLILRLQKKGQGAKDLKTILKTSQDAWEKQIARLLLGGVSKNEMLKEASKSEPYTIASKMCDVYYYSGMLYLIAGEAGLARESFKQCLATNRFDYGEYILAAAELRRLDRAAR